MNSTRSGIGRYPRKKSIGLVPAFTGGASYETLHRQQRERAAAGLPKVAPCPLCRGLAMHYEGCPETWGNAEGASPSQTAATYSEETRRLGQTFDAAA